MKDKSPLFQRSVTLIRAIPKGKISTYGQIADLIGAPGCARHISYVLSSSSKKYDLPWHRVISSSGKLPKHRSQFRQMKLLKAEGILSEYGAVDLDDHLWKPSKTQVRSLMKGLPKHTPLHKR